MLVTLHSYIVEHAVFRVFSLNVAAHTYEYISSCAVLYA